MQNQNMPKIATSGDKNGYIECIQAILLLLLKLFVQ